VGPGEVRQGEARLGVLWFGVARQGVARFGFLNVLQETRNIGNGKILEWLDRAR